MNYRNTANQIEDFAGMAENYNTTKPVVSKNHTREDNIRPVGRRSRKHEHMIKVSARQYMIYDGYTVGDPKFNRWGNKVPPTPEETLALAPIVWTLSPKGDIETIRIRNGSGDYAHCARYTFLENTLPQGLQLHVYSGKQYISNGTQYLLPKSDYRPDYVGHTIHSKDDKKYLTFARKVGGGRYDWKVVGDTWKVQHERKRVDTKAKAKIKPHADVFYKWLDTMHSFIMPDFGDGYNRWRDRSDFIEKANNELNEFLSGWVNNTGYGYTPMNYEERPKEQHDKLIEIMGTDQHPMRTQLGIDFLRNVDFEHVTDGSQVRSKYNSYVNKVFGLVGTLTKEKIVKDK
jgi:hypothetical protein